MYLWITLRGHRGGLGRSDVVVKLITPRFTPLLYISREKYLISRFLTKNLYKCGTPHKYIISKRTLRTSWLHFRKYIYLGYITYNKRGLNIRGSVLSYFVQTPTPCPALRCIGKGVKAELFHLIVNVSYIPYVRALGHSQNVVA